MNLEVHLSFVLRYGSLIGVIVTALGLLLHFAGAEVYESIIITGIVVIVLTPFAGMVVSFISLAANRERGYAISVLILIMMTLAGISIGYYVG